MTELLTQYAEPAGLITGFLLTVMVLSYIIGDNFLFRLAVHVFVGVASGYAAILIIYNVLWYQVLVPLLQVVTGEASGGVDLLSGIIPGVLLGAWLLSKSSPRMARWGNPVLAFLVGVGAATMVGGVVVGTLFPQVSAAASLLDLQNAPAQVDRLVGWFINGIFMLAGTVASLLYFHFGVRTREGELPQRHPAIEVAANIGQGFLVVTLGVLFAGVYLAALAALIERMQFIIQFLLSYI